MNVGQQKGTIITEIIATERPSSILEIGGYVGYSAIMFGSAMRKSGVPAPRYVSLEMNPKFASVARALVEIAGLSDFVEILEGPCRESLRRLAAGASNQRTSLNKWDMLFLDHSKISYLNDLKLAEELGVVAPGSIVIADDMKRPGNPMYSDYVRADTATKVKAYAPFAGCLSDGGISLGNPYLIYETTLLEGLEPTGHMVSSVPYLLRSEKHADKIQGCRRDITVCGFCRQEVSVNISGPLLRRCSIYTFNCDILWCRHP